MRARPLWIALTLFALGGAVAGCSGPKPGPKPPEPEPPKVTEPQPPPPPAVIRGPHGVEIAEADGLVFAYLEVEGIPYAEMGDEIARAARLLEEQGIRPEGFSRTVYLDDPRAVDTASYHYRVGFPVPRTALPRKPLRREVIEPRLIARARHQGDYDEAYQLEYYERIPAALKDFGYDVVGPITEIYCYPLVQQDPAKWVTEVWYPVRKRAAEAATPEKTPERTAPAGTSEKGNR